MVYIVEADDEYILKRKIKDICNQFLGTINEFNFLTFDITTTLTKDITGTFLSNSMFDDKKAVVIENAYFISKKKERIKYLDDENFNDLFLLLNKMSKENIVIFSLYDATLNEKSDFLKDLKYEHVVCEKIGHDYRDYGDQLKVYEKYSKDIINELKVNIDTNAYQKLKTYWMPLFEFKNELIKLSNYDDHITLENVEKLTPIPLSKTVFELTNALFNDDKQQALKIFNDLQINNIEVVQIINTCASLIHFLYLVKYWADKGNTTMEIADKLNENHTRVKKNLSTANNSTLGGIRKVLNKLGDLDFEIKKGQIADPSFAFSNFILNFSLK